MDTKQWEREIRRQCKKAGTYEPFYENIITALAMLLSEKDKVFAKYVEAGGSPVVEHTNKAGATNIVKNPMLVAWLDINSQALAYWRDLGLTPKGYRTLSGEKVSKDSEGNPLLDIIQGLAE